MSLLITPVPVFPGLHDWEELISFRPPQEVQLGVNFRFQTFGFPSKICHPIEEGTGPINLDYYPIRVEALPTRGNLTRAATLFEHIRRNINNFVDASPDGCVFTPYDPIVDAALWTPPVLQQSLPGAVVHIDVNSLGVNVDDGSVVVSESNIDHWIFSTIWTPGDLAHPVSGNRQFGFVAENAGEFTIYTRGADRLTSWIDEQAGQMAFAGANLLWTSFQHKVFELIESEGGKAAIPQPTSNRYDWVAVKASYFHPTVNWL